MTQIRLTFPTTGTRRRGTLSRAADGTLAADDGIETYLTVLLFTDLAAPAEELDEGEDARGWWGDAFDVDGEPMGSHVWIPLRTGLLTDEIAASIADRATERLQVAVSDGIARSARAEVLRNEQGARLRVEMVPAKQTANQQPWEKFFALR